MAHHPFFQRSLIAAISKSAIEFFFFCHEYNQPHATDFLNDVDDYSLVLVSSRHTLPSAAASAQECPLFSPSLTLAIKPRFNCISNFDLCLSLSLSLCRSLSLKKFPCVCVCVCVCGFDVCRSIGCMFYGFCARDGCGGKQWVQCLGLSVGGGLQRLIPTTHC